MEATTSTRMTTRYQQKLNSFSLDISQGQEQLPIPLICPRNITLPRFCYIVDHHPNGVLPSPPRWFKGCECTSCNRTCPCMKLAQTINNKLAAKLGRTNLSPGIDYSTADVRCNSRCKCSSSCPRRQLTNHPNLPRLEVRYINETLGFGVFACQNIRKGAFIGTYLGKVYEYGVYTKNAVEGYYYYMVNPQIFKHPILIDASSHGNFTRFINHSCKPNISAKTIYTGDTLLPYPSFYTTRKIVEGEQIFLDYGPNYFRHLDMLCCCGHCNGDAII